jgi:aldehyde:ferredoxin oxidoreductase
VNGNWGVALMVDLGTGEVTRRQIPGEWFADYIGGEGVAMRLFAELVDFDGLPLEASQPLIAAVGPLTGTAAPSSGRTCFVFRSPASGAIGASNVGGHLSPAIKKAGYDLIVFTGEADNPVYVVIDDDTVEIRDAMDLWGMGVHDTEAAIRTALDGKGWQLATIGPAGENGVLYAAIMTDGERAAGRERAGGEAREDGEGPSAVHRGWSRTAVASSTLRRHTARAAGA